MRRASERALVADRPVAARLEAERVGRLVADERDPAVPELEQIPRRELAAGDVVDHDARQPVVPRVDQHARDRPGAEPPDLLVRRDQRDDEQAVRPMGVGEQAERALLAVGRFDVVEREVVGRRRERRHDSADALDRRGLGQERQHDADHERPLERKVLGDRARPVLEGTDRLEHPLPRGRRDAARGRSGPGRPWRSRRRRARRRPRSGPAGSEALPSGANVLPARASEVKPTFLDFKRGEHGILAAPWSTGSGSN